MNDLNANLEVGDVLKGEIRVPCTFCRKDETKSEVIKVRTNRHGNLVRFDLNPIGCFEGHSRWQIMGGRVSDFERVERSKSKIKGTGFHYFFEDSYV